MSDLHILLLADTLAVLAVLLSVRSLIKEMYRYYEVRPMHALNSLGVSYQLWEGRMPHTVVTLWWPRLRKPYPTVGVYFWKGKRK